MVAGRRGLGQGQGAFWERMASAMSRIGCEASSDAGVGADRANAGGGGDGGGDDGGDTG